ncbi:hypothetical protein D3C86_2067390 [compost metagenome]
MWRCGGEGQSALKYARCPEQDGIQAFAERNAFGEICEILQNQACHARLRLQGRSGSKRESDLIELQPGLRFELRST